MTVELPPIDSVWQGEDGTVAVSGHYWVDDRYWVEIVWTAEHQHGGRELVGLESFYDRYPTPIER
jgi:hypothetical protein